MRGILLLNNDVVVVMAKIKAGNGYDTAPDLVFALINFVRRCALSENIDIAHDQVCSMDTSFL